MSSFQKKQQSNPFPETFNVADHQYSVDDYAGATDVEQGTAVTHEQTSDSYMVGTEEDGSERIE